MKTINKLASIVSTTCLGLVLATNAAAQDYPSRPVTIVVPFATGGPTDTAARITAAALAKQTGGSFIVENVPGAGATIGAAKAAQARPDGYTLLWGSSSMAITTHLQPNLRFHPVRSFTPVGFVGEQPFVLVTNPSRGYRTAADLIKQAKAAPGKMNFSSAGIGSSTQLVAELFRGEEAIDATHVPYNGGAPASQAVVAGDVDFMFDTPTTAVPLVKGGRLTALAVTGPSRWGDLPEVPTLAEAGLRDIKATAWMGLVAPTGTPADIVSYLNKHLNSALRQSDVSSALRQAGFVASPSSPQEFGDRISAETARWGDIVRTANIKLN